MIVNASGGLELLSSIDIGVNSFILNGTVINPTEWIGSGNYTFTINGLTYTIQKASSQGGNWQLIQDTDFTYHFRNARSKTQEIIDLIYPVGSIYMSVNAVNPANLFGGSWEQIKDTFLLSAGDNYNNGDVGGSADAIVPYHTHTVASSGYIANGVPSAGAHRHSDYHQTANRGSGNVATRVGPYGYTTSGASAVTGGESGAHTHNLPNHTHTINHAGTDGNTNGANMPPYLVVNVWKRTA